MTDKTRIILTQAGVDLESGKERLMGNEKLLLRMLFKIDHEKNCADLMNAFASKDVDSAIYAAHSLKGLFGGLSVMPLYDLFTQQTALLRAGDFAAAQALLPRAVKEMEALQKALAQARQAEG